MRATIKAVFPDRDAFTLLRPMLREEDLNRLDTIPYSKLRPEFQKVGGLVTLGVVLKGQSCRSAFCWPPAWPDQSSTHPLVHPSQPATAQGMDEFMGMLRAKAHPLQFNGQMVSGRVYSQLAEAYVTALNQGAVPQLVTAWQGIARAEGFKEEGCDEDAQLYDRFQVRWLFEGRGGDVWDMGFS